MWLKKLEESNVNFSYATRYASYLDPIRELAHYKILLNFEKLKLSKKFYQYHAQCQVSCTLELKKWALLTKII
jgi:hypothetical protein